MLVNLEQNRMVQTTRNFEFFDKKQVFITIKTIFDKELTPFWKTFLRFLIKKRVFITIFDKELRPFLKMFH